VGVRGLLNVQYALQSDILYVLEANPRASRTVPFVSKATAVPLAKAAARVMLGATVAQLRQEGLLPPVGDGANLPLDSHISVKEAVLPFGRFRDAGGRGVDTVLGPEMRSTGEVMGIDDGFGTAYAKSQAAAYASLPTFGRVFVSVANRDKRAMIFPIKRLADLGFVVYATEGTADVLRRNGVKAVVLGKHREPQENLIDCVEMITSGQIDLVINTPWGVGPRLDGYEIRTACVAAGVPCITTIQGAAACVQGIESLVRGELGVRSLQEYHAILRATWDETRAAANAGVVSPAVPSGSTPGSVPGPMSGSMSGSASGAASGGSAGRASSWFTREGRDDLGGRGDRPWADRGGEGVPGGGAPSDGTAAGTMSGGTMSGGAMAGGSHQPTEAGDSRV